MTGGGGGQRLLLRPWHRWSCGWRWPLLCTAVGCLLLMPDTTQAAALELAERLRQAIATMRVRCDPVQLSVTASFGVAQLQPGQSAEQWIERADLALYRAKRQGRNQVCADTAMG